MTSGFDENSSVLLDVDDRKVATVTLNRPTVNNAYDGEFIECMIGVLDALEKTPGLRAVVIKSRGKHFQAGADLKWLNKVRASSPKENLSASRATAQVVQRINLAPVPTIALVQGACFGGGTGVLAACDIVIAAEDAVFSIAEVRWGLTPSVIIPQLNDAIGVRQVRRYALSAERFDAQEARRIGLVHEVVPTAELEAVGNRFIDQMLQNGPQAISQTKAAILESAWGGPDEAKFDRLAEIHSRKRQSSEAGEGLLSFAEKRTPVWK